MEVGEADPDDLLDEVEAEDAVEAEEEGEGDIAPSLAPTVDEQLVSGRPTQGSAVLLMPNGLNKEHWTILLATELQVL